MRNSLVRSAVTSIFTTALDISVLTALVEFVHINYVLATFLGTLVGATSNYFINRHWSFEATHGRKRWQIMRLVPVQAGSSLMQTAGVWLFTEYVGFKYWGSKLVVAVLVYLVWNYPMNRFFVFGKKIASRGTSAGTSPLAG